MINGGTGGRYEPGEAPAPEDGGEEGDDDDEAGDGEEEEEGDDDDEVGDGEEEEEVEAEVEVEDVDTGVRTTSKTKKKKGSSGKGARWMGLEDLCLTEAWKVIGLDPITGAQLLEAHPRRVPRAAVQGRLCKDAHDPRPRGMPAQMELDTGCLQHLSRTSREDP